MQKLCFILLLFAIGLTAAPLSGQNYIGVNAGGVLGRTVDAQGFVYLKNNDWICITAGGGYTAPGPFLFAKNEECLRKFFNHGWHLRAGFRNCLTTDHHFDFFFWGMQLVYSGSRERATQTFCDTFPDNDVVMRHNVKSLSAALNLGFSWNPFRGKTYRDRLALDFGLQFSTPIVNSEPFYSDRRYISGLGYSPLPFRSIHLEPVLIARYELSHGRYGPRRSFEYKNKKLPKSVIKK